MHPTETFNVVIAGRRPQTFIFPSERKSEVTKLLARMQQHDDSIPAEEVFPQAFDPVQGPAMALRSLRHREGVSQKQLAEMLGIRQHHLSEMEHGKRSIGKAMAKRIAKALHANWRVLI